MKKQHPILKMRRTLEKKHYLPRVIWPPQNQAVEADIARHVKPLLDELERGIRLYYPSGPNQRKASDLLAEWREKW